ncbi:MAG: 16S rRNA (cytosine(1402)-N(4))-methyltransferase RsmH [Prevotella sp.]|nr:16S rRNA (cytosine(1402)-N(4))-methyltransferase RsmH [Prevotella sp.]
MTITADSYHVPVLLRESVDGLSVRPDGIYVDVTFGGGGHSTEILSRLGADGRLFGFDQDEDVLGRVPRDSRFTFVRSNFRYLHNWMRYYGVEQIDGLLADLGVSSHHFDDESRGFSFRFDAPLDMRMNRRAPVTAADIVNGYDEQQLADVFWLYGELRQSRRMAARIVKARAKHRIETTRDFIAAATGRELGGNGDELTESHEKKDMARLFQALRIEVNHEMSALQEMLAAATNLLRPGGRLVVITYHSLEDRMVKNVMKSGNIEGRVKQDFFGRAESPFTLVNNKVTTPSPEEQAANPRSRSAKLRVAERVAE